MFFFHDKYNIILSMRFLIIFYITYFLFFFNEYVYAYIGLAPIISLLTGLGWIFSSIIIIFLGVIIYPIWIIRKKKNERKHKENQKN